LRQIEDFSSNYLKHSASCLMWTVILLGWVWISVVLHLNGFDMKIIFTAVAALAASRLYVCGVRLLREERQAVILYRNYLDTFSYQVLQRMLADSNMSAWSRREIGRYLHDSMCWGY